MILCIRNIRNFGLILLAGTLVSLSSCNKKDYPCPGLGQSNEADLSMFDESGQLKKDKNRGRMNKKTGLVNKKKPKRLNAPRKTHL